MLVLLVLVTVAILARGWWAPSAPEGTIVEVAGDVPHPGYYVLDPPTLASAVDAAGGDGSGLPNTPLVEGDRVIVSADGVHVAPSSDPSLVGLPVDINHADAAALQALPGIGDATAARIVAERGANGPFDGIDDLQRVEGVGEATIARLRPYLTASGAP